MPQLEIPGEMITRGILRYHLKKVNRAGVEEDVHPVALKMKYQGPGSLSR
jgi:hypothetical protein